MYNYERSQKIDDLQKMIDNHDCDLGPDNGCDCLLWKNEKAKLLEEDYLEMMEGFINENLARKKKFLDENGISEESIRYREPKTPTGSETDQRIFWFCVGLKCVSCGRPATWKNLKWCNWDITKVMCFRCQNEPHEPYNNNAIIH